MLIRFVVSNFLSLDEEREFNMLAGSFKTHKHHVYDIGKINVLKAAAIYGANGAGKSNFIKAIDFLKRVVEKGHITRTVNDKKFKLNKSNSDKPVSFEIEFSIDKKVYAYGVSFNNLAVTEEWLYESGITTDDKLIFERRQSKSGKPSIKIADRYQKTQKQKYLIELMEENLLKVNELFLGKSDSLKISVITKVRSWIENNLVIIYPGSRFTGLIPAITSERFKLFANDLLETFDTGVKELGIETIDFEKYFGEDDEEIKKEILSVLTSENAVSLDSAYGSILVTKENKKVVVKKVISLHHDSKGNNVAFDLEDESDGTQRLLDFIPAFDGMLNSEVTFIIDEVDQSLHPALLRSLIHKIMMDSNTKGQLIFTTHESNLLDFEIFRPDEIWFAEKDNKSGGTQLYSLSEFKPRYDLDIRKGYLKGRFGAIPFLANLEELNWHEHDA